MIRVFVKKKMLNYVNQIKFFKSHYKNYLMLFMCKIYDYNSQMYSYRKKCIFGTIETKSDVKYTKQKPKQICTE